MPRRFNCRRVVAAAILAALAVLPNLVHGYPAVWCYRVPASEVAWVRAELPMSPTSWINIDVDWLESAKAFASGWQTYGRLSLLFAGLAPSSSFANSCPSRSLSVVTTTKLCDYLAQDASKHIQAA